MIKKCLLPVAGYGKRFLTATKAMPKEMLPIVNMSSGDILNYFGPGFFCLSLRPLIFLLDLKTILILKVFRF
jgi:hypothetical protein